MLLCLFQSHFKRLLREITGALKPACRLGSRAMCEITRSTTRSLQSWLWNPQTFESVTLFYGPAFLQCFVMFFDSLCLFILIIFSCGWSEPPTSIRVVRSGASGGKQEYWQLLGCIATSSSCDQLFHDGIGKSLRFKRCQKSPLEFLRTPVALACARHHMHNQNDVASQSTPGKTCACWCCYAIDL